MVPAAFFDMDKTVLRIDSGLSWMKFLRRRREISRLGLMRAFWWNALYQVALLDLQSLADKLVADIAGDPEAEMIAKLTAAGFTASRAGQNIGHNPWRMTFVARHFFAGQAG